MIKNFIKSIFGGGSSEATEATKASVIPAVARSEEGFSAVATATESPELEKFVEYIVSGLVDNPGAVSVVAEPAENDTIKIKINCAKPDVGKVVGKRGKTIVAIRSLVNGAASRIQRRVLIEVVD